MPPITLLPKLVIVTLFLAACYQVSTYQPVPYIKQGLPSVLTDQNNSQWFSDAIKAPHGDSIDDEYDDDPSSPAHSKKPTIPERDYSRTHISYGQTQCMPHFNAQWKQAALDRNASCTQHAPFPTQETRRVGFASITTGASVESYQRAILTQMFHAAVHDTSAHVLCESLTSGMWNKIAFLLHLVMTELLKPASQRLEWMMWIDRDAIVLDACRPLSSFLPPQDPAFDKIELIVNEDNYGLNAGVFLFKVSTWMVDYLSDVLAIRHYRNPDTLPFAEQSGMAALMQEENAKGRFAKVPWYWFNAYPDEEASVEKYRQNLEPEDLEFFRARKGDFIAHFAGDVDRVVRMGQWEDMVEEEGNVWAGETKRDITSAVEQYWQAWRSGTLTMKHMTGEDEEAAALRKEKEAEMRAKKEEEEKQEKEKEEKERKEKEKEEEEREKEKQKEEVRQDLDR
ncbi:hypothetical protein IAQ61_004653 [Plenodomus lingam]|uniref:Predicted protein n=1 Tax=Leptosphaeria maculans (strain JN3 / isolate v23.1.3 / race Av1-4-5-6-7-8) TaxID=985895 RepID=E4ZW42_LEPMJ|nr:predicted protein [Plenodomus lingam JN3]KAH9874025.1 hypothetical protein IAQ61_004653 [Plenodomus lingam]CBX95818.1 predicted protein [Plenodomus lingam JN3]